MSLLESVCSNRQRPSVHKGSKGNQWWRREVFHLRVIGQAKTVCGRDAADYLVIGKWADSEDTNCCKICKKQVMA